MYSYSMKGRNESIFVFFKSRELRCLCGCFEPNIHYFGRYPGFWKIRNLRYIINNNEL